MFDETTLQEWIDAIDEHVLHLLAAVGVAAPPVNALQVARACGCAVAVDGRQRERGRCVRLQGSRGATIVLRPEPRRERTQWSIAHELGESQLADLATAAHCDPRELTSAVREWIANQFANRLLLPTDWFTAHGQQTRWNLLELKRIFGSASHELIARRMLETRSNLMITVLDQGKITWRSGRGIRVPTRLLPAEKGAWQLAHQSGSPASQVGRAVSAQAWPIHESHWRREIIVTELPEPDADSYYEIEEEGAPGAAIPPPSLPPGESREIGEQDLCKIGFAHQIFDP
jgi:hypothetical protein